MRKKDETIYDFILAKRKKNVCNAGCDTHVPFQFKEFILTLIKVEKPNKFIRLTKSITWVILRKFMSPSISWIDFHFVRT